jgi:hypothetical protein
MILPSKASLILIPLMLIRIIHYDHILKKARSDIRLTP